MKLKSFRVTNYRSIIDSKECFLSPNDGITILAGQNESGKSSMLEALRYYEIGLPLLEAYRDEEDIKNAPKVQCTYAIEEGEDLYEELVKLDNTGIEVQELLKSDLLKIYIHNIKEVRLERTISHSNETKFSIRYILNNDIKNVISLLKKEEIYKTHNETSILTLLGNALFRLTPIITFFDDYDLLPEKFYIEDLESEAKPKGLQAVKNIETILGTKFSDLIEASDNKVSKKEKEYKDTLTAEFNERWRQRIGDETGAVISITYKQGGKEGKPYLRFLIETREGEALPPEKRSLGFKWFLSFYLHLTATNKDTYNLLLLFDEPGLHLHSKAQHDMLLIFEEIATYNQIIYATHSPYLIDTNKLHRLRLVFNSKAKGTTVEKITTNISPNQKDAIKPIIDALGLHVAHDFSAAKDKNIIVEGISDYYYLSAAKKIFNVKGDFYFMPAMGASNAHLLMELCIGWGLKWLMIFDEKGSIKDVNKIKANFFSKEDNIDNKIHILKGCDGIEDIFEESDIKLAAPSFVRTDTSLSKDLSNHGGKELIGRLFSDKAEAGEITADKLSEKARNHFKMVFSFIERGFQ